MHRQWRWVGVAAGGVLGCGGAWVWGTTEQALVDFSVTGAAMTHQASGFLHSIDPGSPSDAMMTPLHPQMLRMRPDAAVAMDGRASALGVQHMQIIVSDGFNPEYDGPYPGDGGNWAPWDSYVTNLATRVASDAVPVQFDVWNEPDLSAFWKRDQATFFEAWRRAVLDIRAANPLAEIVGPSFSNYSNTKIGMQSFLLYARDNNVLPDVLSWHEFGGSFVQRVADVRSFMAASSIGVSRVSINEIVGTGSFAGGQLWQSAGPLARYFSDVARADVESVAHACWDEPNAPGVNNGENASLDGLLTPDTKEPRSTWWMYEKYGEMGGTVSGFDAGVVKNAKGIVTFDGLSTKEDGVAHVLFGRFVSSTSQLDSSPVQVKLTNMDLVPDLVPGGSGTVRVIGEQIADSGLAASGGPTVRMNQILTVANGQLVVPVNSFGRTDSYFLTIEALGTWIRDADGVWSDTTAWSDKTPPSGVASVARFGAAATARRTVTLDAPRTVGRLTFDNPVGYRIAGSSTLTMDNGASHAVIAVLQGSNEIAAPVRPSAAGAGPDLTVSNGATLKISNDGGVRLAHVSLATSGTLDTGGNDLLVDPDASTSQTTLVRQLLKQAYNTGQWDGIGGIRSSGVTGASGTSLGYAAAGAIGLTTFQGQAVDPLAVLVRQTFSGDTNLDGRLDADDFARLDRGFAGHLTGWVNGDFNYDNVINAADYQIIQAAWALQHGAGLASAAVDARYASDLAVVVPEPPAAMVPGAAMVLILRRPRQLRST